MMRDLGTLVLVVGPSGSGKDTLLRLARMGLRGDDRFVFPRRIVTREAVAETEDHGSVDRGEFDAMRKAGGFALDWEAHGLDYGLPASISGDLAAGRTVVCNGSRRVIAAAADRFPRCHAILVHAHAEVRARRLALRGRETAAEIAVRLNREAEPIADVVPTTRIDNSGDLAVGATAILVTLLNVAVNEPTAS
ncbi:MAG TPA: phosphonate metabolism protein/1,5-bisphosphokinase (PRPP-forming) PhnN [Devosiaceae bacterium]|jgi:phosphonate metabolism protein PhnN/1,5-bisphosphokinase (PRPP-forming)|nr:phosphonate metabolism protein/1,5-bisphosphokinase (PRPP-forming) PhnN [Devosiaceae bacterium]